MLVLSLTRTSEVEEIQRIFDTYQGLRRIRPEWKAGRPTIETGEPAPPRDWRWRTLQTDSKHNEVFAF
jgi:hypothetical protein